MSLLTGDLENAQLKPSKAAPQNKLYGYLNKRGVKGTIRAWKSHWFFYDENNCHSSMSLSEWGDELSWGGEESWVGVVVECFFMAW